MLAATAAAWDDVLAAVPTDRLEGCFTAALTAKRDTFPLQAGAILAAWDEALQARRESAATAARALPGGATQPCGTCKGAGRVRRPTGEIIPCPPCAGRGTEAAPAPTFFVGELLPVLAAFCTEHRDPVGFPYRLRCALLAAGAGLYAAAARGILEATGAPTLYTALTAALADTGVTVPAPPPPPTAAPGTWQRLNVEAAL